MFGLEAGMTIILIICILAVCFFEFINGFHDTANAVATVIYTKSMKPNLAVIWSGFFNFLGILISGFYGLSVAMGIINLLPTAILIDSNAAHGISMVLSIIITSIVWNIGTWYLGIPCSSSHTLLGSIFGVGLAYGFLPDVSVAMNWQKVKDVGLALLISPVFGFGLTMGLVLLLKKFSNSKKLFSEPDKKKAPPFWIRLTLLATCTSVSFTHGQNDGQKGVGLLMIVLIALAPVYFAVNQSKQPQQLLLEANRIEIVLNRVDNQKLTSKGKASKEIIQEHVDTIQSMLSGVASFNELPKEHNFRLRTDIILLSKEVAKLLSKGTEEPVIKLSNYDKSILKSSNKTIKGYTEYAPFWVILLIAISLGIGTMIGWKRIVVTIGERIGKEHLTYAQGASAELVAASTIGVSSLLGLPVSTTHVLSSGIAGSMVATNGLKNLRMKTVKGILIAWLITLPVTILVSGGLFLLFRLLA